MFNSYIREHYETILAIKVDLYDRRGNSYRTCIIIIYLYCYNDYLAISWFKVFP